MITFRQIQKADNLQMARVIRTVLEEFKVNQPGTVYTDPTTDCLYELFQLEGSIYWVAEKNGQPIGGCGIYPTIGLPKQYAELVKLYILSEFRGLGIGKGLIRKSIESAKEMGFKYLYLESLPELNSAIELYQKIGFKVIDKRLGESGHFACNLWMEMNI